LDISDFDFALPDELIAQEPSPARGGSRLLVLGRRDGHIEHTWFGRIADFLRPGDVLVVNNSRVFPARLIGRRLPGGGSVECLLMQSLETDLWDALVHPGQKLKPGSQMLFEGDGVRLHGEIVAMHFHGRRTIRLWTDGDLDVAAVIERIGHMPLPPYIRRADRAMDRERYQTVYARERGSIAAPTAGLHFTDEILARLSDAGVERVEVTLHVGYGTFKPIRATQVDDHVVDPEPFVVSREAADALTRARKKGKRIVAVGTTTVRVLESLRIVDGQVLPGAGNATVFIRPGHSFQLVDALVTNFHLPRSSLLVLVAAFAGRGHVLHAYREAITHQYMFYSYGDAMLII
jgi:S-adenosylmethionine:tRNA ribosyltransferase-isomerase